MPRTKTQIFNDALDALNEQPISSDADTTKVALWLARNFDQQRDYLLERYYWKFALTRAVLSPDFATPAFGWDRQYRLPADCIRLAPLTANGDWNGTPLIFEREGDMVLCDWSEDLRIRYVRRVETVGLFSSGFCECLALRLAARMAHWMTGKQSMMQQIQQTYQQTVSEVVQTEAVQVAQDDYYDDDILWKRLT